MALTKDWPASSPDMSPIEHLWDILDRKIRPNINENSTLNDVRQLLQREWQSIPQKQIDRLIRSMRSRVGECLQNQGGYTQ